MWLLESHHLHLEVLPMIMAVKRNIEEGDLIPTFMDIDLMLMEIDVTVKMDITKTPKLSFLWSKFLVLMGIVILMCT